MKQYEKKVYSQNGEDGIIAHIFDKIGTTNKVAVEFGVSQGMSGAEANTRLLTDSGWKLFWFDLNNNIDLPVNSVFTQIMLTKDNIVNEFLRLQIPFEFDLLSIDVDSNDYHLREALSVFRPRVYVIEYNGSIPPDVPYIMPHNINYEWTMWKTNFGASLLSYTEQAERLGYDLVYCDSQGVNAFYIRKDINVFPKLTSEQAWVKLWWAHRDGYR
jgi:hypothetical protein